MSKLKRAGVCLVEDDFQKLALAPDRLQGGLPGLLECSFEPASECRQQLLARRRLARPIAKDPKADSYPLKTVRLFECRGQCQLALGYLERTNGHQSVKAATSQELYGHACP